MKMFKNVLLASAAVLMLAGTAVAGPAFKAAPDTSTPTDRMAAPPWWYPIWGTWVGGTNIKICASLTEISTGSSGASMTTIHLNNIDGTDLEFTLDLGSSGAVAVWQSLIAACDHSDDHEAANWKHRWYKIDLETSGPGVTITSLSGAGDQTLRIIKSVTVPTAHGIPSH